MTATRRDLLLSGGGLLAALAAPSLLRAQSVEVIAMKGTARGERVWFSPRGLAVAAGTTLRFVNRDPVNSHTATSYAPAFYDRQRRIPEAAEAWDSGFLLPDESFEVTLQAPGVYDYYCIPHESAGMLGRIVVGRPEDPGWQDAAPPTDDIAPDLLAALPGVESILEEGRIDREEQR